MKRNIYDDFIDIALDCKDFKWAKELYETKQNTLKEDNLNNNTDENFTLGSVALEDIHVCYGIKESNGIRAINYNSKFDIIQGNIVQLSKNKYRTDEVVNYKILNTEEESFVRGYFFGYLNNNQTNTSGNYEQGYADGYQKGYNEGCSYTYSIMGGYEKTINDLKNVLDDKSKDKKKWSLFSFKNKCKQK